MPADATLLEFLMSVDVTPMIVTETENVSLSSAIATLPINMSSRLWCAWFCNNKRDNAHAFSIKKQEEKVIDLFNHLNGTCHTYQFLLMLHC